MIGDGRGPADGSGEPEPSTDPATDLRETLRTYNADLGRLLGQRTWRPRDPELQKRLGGLFATTAELLGYCGPGPASLSTVQRDQVAMLLTIDPDKLSLDAAIDVAANLDRILVDVGDEAFICEEILGELRWKAGSTTWLTWDSMFEPKAPAAVSDFQAGTPVKSQDLESARHMLASLRRERSSDYQVHRARLKMRATNLQSLGLVLLVFVLTLGALLPLQVEVVALSAVAGALGSAVSGTIKARDHLVRGSDLRAFSAGLWAQIMLGAVAGLFVLMVMNAGLLTIGGAEGPMAWGAVAFAAGFSEPFWLRTVEHVAKLGSNQEADSSIEGER